ncbi:MAG: hypothetical protein EBU08_07515 [Micrococcales bacterium]|nr:hypothetical protein [Micrococcales bacterium]
MTTDTPMVAEVDCSTGIQTNRPMTAEEIANWEAIRAESARLEEERQVAATALAALKASARAKLIAGEPLTAEEAAVLVI